MLTTRHLAWAGLAIGLLFFGGCDSEPAGARTEETSATLSGPQGDSLLEVTATRPEQAQLGQEMTFGVRIENVADQPVEGVRVSQQAWSDFEVLGTHLQRDGGSEESGQSGGQQSGNQDDRSGQQSGSQGRSSDGQHRWQIGTLAAGEVVDLQVRGIPHSEGEHVLRLEVDYDAPLTIPVDVVDPELRLARSFERYTFWICEGIEATYVVTNKGTGTARSITVEDQLPDGLTTEDGENVVRFETDPLEADEDSEHEFMLKAARPGEYTWRATASAGDQSLQTQAARLRVLQPDLSFSVQNPESPLKVGTRAVAVVTIENVGDGPAADVSVVVEDDENIDDLTVQGEGEVDDEVNFGTLEAGERRKFRLEFAPEEIGALSLTLRADARCLPEEQRFVHSFETEVAGTPAARIEVVDENDPVTVGEEVEYSIRVTNQGTGADMGIRVRALLPDTLEFVSADGATEAQAVEGQQNAISFASVERLDPDEDVEWTLRAKAISAGEGKLLVELRSDELVSVVKEEEPTTTVQ